MDRTEIESKLTDLLVDELFYFLDEEGRLSVARFSPTGVEVLATADLLEEVSWTPPILIDGLLYARDRKDVVAVDLTAAAYED